jgi:pilus assembly protein CpaE
MTDADMKTSDSKILVGVISPSAELREQLRNQLRNTQFACDVMEVDKHCADKGCVRKFADAKPKVIFIDMDARDTALSTLRHLHDALPETIFYVSSASKDPKLIIESMQAGAREFLVRPVDELRIAQALERYSVEQAKIEANRLNGKIYCVTSAKGGAGTTSVALNLAVATALCACDGRVALVDLGNPVGNISEYLDISPKFYITDAVAHPFHLDSASINDYMSRTHGVAVLSGHSDFGSDPQLGDSLRKLFKALTGAYSHTFVDIACPQSQAHLEAAAKYSAAVLIVLTPELPVLRGTERLVQIFEKIGANHKLRLIVNRGRKSRLEGAIEIERDLGQSIFWYLPDDYPAAAKAINIRQPLVTENHSNLAESYFGLVKTLTGMEPPKRKRKFWWFA